MRCVFILAMTVLIGCIPLDAMALNGNGKGDYITAVYACGTKIIINTKSEGWVYADASDTNVGQSTANWILAIALELLSTGKQIGSFFEPTGTAVGTGCGVTAVEITTLEATTTP